ncbi:MAG: ATP-binding protein [Clostridia bacterium]|nr:ATP-binding protein [Clostridia bacterium]
MDNQAWDRVRAEFERKRDKNAREEARRQREIGEKHPDLYALMKQRHEMILSAARAGLTGAAPENAEQVMREYNEKIAALLSAYGFPRDYLAPVCDCPLCGDTGYVYEQAVQRPCECLRKAYLSALGQEARRQTEDGAPSFAAFDLDRFPADAPLPGTDITQRDYMRAVRGKCEAYAQGVPGGPVKTLLLHGGSGLGKTYLLRCVESAVKEKGADCLYTTAYDLLMALKNAYFSRSGEDAQVYFDCPLLLIDDLGMEPLIEGVTVEQFYNLFNARITRGLYTAVSTNLPRDEIQRRYTERVLSRLLDTRSALAIPFQGKDIRLIKP